MLSNIMPVADLYDDGVPSVRPSSDGSSGFPMMTVVFEKGLSLFFFVFMNAGSIIYLFREDSMVVHYGTRALKLQSLAGIVMAFGMSTEVLLQSTGKKWEAATTSAIRSGVIFIPALKILSVVRGFAGIQEAQPLAFVLSIVPTLFFAIRYFSKLPKEDG